MRGPLFLEQVVLSYDTPQQQCSRPTRNVFPTSTNGRTEVAVEVGVDVGKDGWERGPRFFLYEY